jgi:hypothetical protein
VIGEIFVRTPTERIATSSLRIVVAGKLLDFASLERWKAR